MPTLFEILKEKFSKKQPPQESKIYNPIGAKVGCGMTIDELDFRDKNFFVREIREYFTVMGGVEFKGVDYVVKSAPLKGDPVTLRLRLAPTNDVRQPFRIITLSLYDNLEYNEGLHNVVKDTTKKFIINEGKEDEETFWRMNDVGISYKAKITTLVDKNSDGEVDEDEVLNSNIEYWDYSRNTKIDGADTEEFLFVEMDAETGWFQIWRGQEIQPEQVMVL